MDDVQEADRVQKPMVLPIAYLAGEMQIFSTLLEGKEKYSAASLAAASGADVVFTS